MILILLLLIVLPFGVVLLFGAPYLPTRRREAERALDMLNLQPGEVFVDLGCGDGAVLLVAAQRGLVCYGYELNPFVWAVARFRTRKFHKTVTIYCRNFWQYPLPKETKGVFVFLLDTYMQKLDEKLQHELKDGVLLSYAFRVPGKKVVAEKGACFLYRYGGGKR